MVAQGNGIYAVSGWTADGGAHGSTKWFDGSSWSWRAMHYGDWGIGVSCLAADTEADQFYLVGGYCPTWVIEGCPSTYFEHVYFPNMEE